MYVIGRAATFICGLGPAAIAAVYSAAATDVWRGSLGSSLARLGHDDRLRRDGPAGYDGRPAGAGGFFLACRHDRRWLPAAAVLLALGCLTKQTAACGSWLR